MLDAIIFDKDGTLFDFRASWGAWTDSVLAELAPNPAKARALGKILGYDPDTRVFTANSPVISMTTPEIAEILHSHLPGSTLTEVTDRICSLAALAPIIPAVDLRVVLSDLRKRGLKLGLATNDTEVPAKTHLEKAGVLDLFDFVVGCDSGWGGKPAPGQLLEFMRRFDLPGNRVAMVGDSKHDLDAGRAAGMHAVAVLTGVATTRDLAPHADVVLPSIAQLAGWIDSLVAL